MLRNETQQFNLGLNRAENLVSFRLREKSGFHVSFTEGRLPYGQSAIKSRWRAAVMVVLLEVMPSLTHDLKLLSVAGWPALIVTNFFQ